jgi:hypothetical protein
MCIIRNDTEAGIGGVFLHNAPQSHLRHSSHGISFVKNYELETAERGCFAGLWHCGKDLFSTFYA